MGQNYQINQFGEIVQEDYFFRSVKGDGVQILPSNRKVWKILLLTIVTLGIYGIVFWLAMGKETNVACKEDGKHTRGFWGTIGLIIITFGVYGIVWMCKWLNREYSFLLRHNHNGILSGKGFLGYYFFMIIVSCLLCILLYAGMVISVYSDIIAYSDMSAYSDIIADPNIIAYSFISLGCCSFIIPIIYTLCLMTSYVRQHNTVCRIYNDINNLVRKA